MDKDMMDKLMEGLHMLVCGFVDGSDEAPLEVKAMSKLSQVSELYRKIISRLARIDIKHNAKYNDDFQKIIDCSDKLISILKGLNRKIEEA